MPFKTRGPLTQEDQVPYITRPIDQELADLIQKIDYVAVMGPRATGKTSLLIHLWESINLLPRYVVCYVNLSLYRPLDEARWYEAVSQALIETAGGALIPAPHSVEESIDFREMLLLNLRASIPDRVLIIMLDDVESVPVEMRTGFFATLREMFVSRGVQPAFRRLAFVLSGSYIPDELIPDPSISPFRIAEKLYVEDATDISPLVNQLHRPDRPLASDAVTRIWDWTEGDLYLTQRLCERLEQRYANGQITPMAVDQVVERYLYEDTIFDNLEHKLRDQPRVLGVIDEVIEKETSLRFTRTNHAIARAWLLGCLKPNQYGNCIARNAIYQQVLHPIIRRLEDLLRPDTTETSEPAQRKRTPDPLHGRYLLESVLRRSVLTQIYRARDLETGEWVVVKQLMSPHGGDVIAWRRFQLEGEALRRLHHPHIVSLIDTFHENNHSYIVMQYVGGGSLDHLLNREGRQPIPLLVEIMLGVADALRYTHECNIVHRDIKPSNILLTAENTPLLADFGVAHFAQQEDRLTATYAVIGTPAYISPEGYDTASFTPAEDVWSLGVTLYEMLTGSLPFNGRTHEHIRYAVLHQPIPDAQMIRPDIPQRLAELLGQMLQRDPLARLANGRAVYEALLEVQQTLTGGSNHRILGEV